MHIVHTESSHGWGGQEIRILEEAAGMRTRGHRVTVIAPRAARIHGEAAGRGLAVVDLPIGHKRPAGVLALRRWLAANPADVVNTHSSTDAWLVALACRLLRAPPPVVRTRHISAPVPDNAATRWLYTGATRHVVTTGTSLRQTLIDRNRFPPARVSSVPTGIPLERFAPGDRAAARAQTGLPADWTIVGIVATLRSWKGHRYLLDALAQLREPRLGLAVVGDGPQRGALEAQVRELALSERVWMAGDQRDVVPWLRSFDIFALPSYANEGVPQALVQAMLAGLPCVTTGAGAIGEAAIDGETALVVAPQDAAALAQAIGRLAADPVLRARLGAAARAHCAKHFGYEAMLDRMEAVFRDAVAAPGPGAPAGAV
jgi:glycosyltransferase involved in cell wall biosynthesis